MNAVGKRLLRDLRKGPSRSLDLSKLALIKWRAGMQFSGGTHAVSRKLRLSERRGALLHYKFTRGAEGILYIAARGQQPEAASITKIFPGTRFVEISGRPGNNHLSQ